MRHSVFNEHGLVVIPVAVGGNGFKNLRCLIKTTKLPQDLNGEKFVALSNVTVAKHFKQALKVCELVI